MRTAIPEVGYAFTQLFSGRAPQRASALPPAVKHAVERGRRLSAALAAAKSPAETAAAIIAATHPLVTPPR